MRALITGGAGFIGSHLAERLLEEGHRVEVIDDLSTGSLDNVSHLRVHPRFGLTIGSVLDQAAAAPLVERCDAIFHLAAAVGVRLIVDSPVQTIETNVKGTETILELAGRSRKPLLLASTSEVYGKSAKVPFSEEDDLVLGPTFRARWSYACSKAVDEFLALAYWRERQVPVVIVRLFNTVGPRQLGTYGMVLPNFVRQALGGEPLTVFGDGSQSRCFCHVTDAVQALAKLAATPEATGRIFNLGSDEEVTILDLARRVRERAGSSSEIRCVPYEQAYSEGFEDMPRRVPDISRITGTIGWRPSHTLNEIIESVIRHEQRAAQSHS